MRIRQATVADRKLIPDADRLCFPADEAVELLHDDVWWVAREKNDLAAYSGLRLMGEDNSIGYLHRQGVMPTYRGRGLQRQLTRTAIEWGRKNGLTRIVTYTNRFNLISTNNLLACGFRLYLPDFLWEQTCFLYLRKDY